MIRELATPDVEDLLYSELFGRLGCHAGDRTYVVPMTYAYDGSSIVAQTGEGLKVTMMRENPRVCFEVDRIDPDGNWQSVIVHGRFEELTGDDARAALQTLMDHVDVTHHHRGILPMHGFGRSVPGERPGGRHEVVFRIRVDEKTGRSETVAWVTQDTSRPRGP